MKYAIIKTSGTQYKVSEGDEIKVARLEKKEGEKVEFNEVLLSADSNKLNFGKPFIKEAKVTGSVVKNFKGEKIHIGKFRAKTGYRRRTGFRSQLSLVKIEKIQA
jgi:large subunit ribosomal protein L21